MLSTVKLNPGLITASKESEMRGDQWRRKDIHDIVAECARLSLDVTETTKVPFIVYNLYNLLDINVINTAYWIAMLMSIFSRSL